MNELLATAPGEVRDHPTLIKIVSYLLSRIFSLQSLDIKKGLLTPRTDVLYVLYDLYDLYDHLYDMYHLFPPQFMIQIFQGRFIPDLCDLYDLCDLAHVAGWEP